MLHVTNAKYVKDYIIWATFDDGSQGNIDLSDCLEGPMFAPLRDKSVFALLKLDSELSTVVWPNGADLAPEFLKQNIV